jgi:enolase
MGVKSAIQNIDSRIQPALVGMSALDQQAIDKAMCELDGTPDKTGLGANAILGVSLATARAAAVSAGIPLYAHLNDRGAVLPVPQACLINGGLHAGNGLDIQEYCVMPVGAATFAEAVRMLSEVFMTLKELLEQRIGRSAINSSEDGGFAPPLNASEQALEMLTAAVAASGYSGEIVLGLDVAATGLYDAKTDTYNFEGRVLSPEQMLDTIKDLVSAFPAIVSIEDPLMEDDFQGFGQLTADLPELMVIGDDIFATNRTRITRGIAEAAGNAVLCKLNQIGTLTEAMQTAAFARDKGFSVVVSERSGETEDAILADVSVALNAGLFKTGGMRGSDRGSKYNRFIEIEAALGEKARYAGRDYKQPVDPEGEKLRR